MVYDSECELWRSARACSGLHASWSRASGLGVKMTLGLRFRVSGFGCQVSGVGFLGVSGFGFSLICFMPNLF